MFWCGAFAVISALAKYPPPSFKEDEVWRSPRIDYDVGHWYKLDGDFSLFPPSLTGENTTNSNSCNIPIRDHYIHETNNTRVRADRVGYLGLPDRLNLSLVAGNDRQPYTEDLSDRGVGPRVVFGHPLDHDRVSYQSLHAYVNHLEEVILPTIYCPGARFRKTFFVGESEKSKYADLDSDCAAACFNYMAGKTEETFDIVDFVHQPWLVGCRVPIVTAFTGKLVKRKFNNGPVGSIQFAASSFTTPLAAARKVQLIDVLLKLQFTGQHANYFYNPDTEYGGDVAWLADNIYDIALTPSGFPTETFSSAASAHPSRKRLSVQAILGTAQRKDDGKPAETATDHMKSPVLTRRSRGTGGSRRNYTDWYTEDYEFYEDGTLAPAASPVEYLSTDRGQVAVRHVPIQSPLKIMAASSLEYGAFGMNNFKWPTNTGYYSDKLRVVEMPEPFEAVVDISTSIRRVFDSGHFEFALLSSATLLDASEDFVFHVARDWLYYISPRSSCTEQRTSRDCEFNKCNWCGKLQTGDDWLHTGWSGYQNLQGLGSCGVPVDVCYLKRGIPTRSMRT